MKLVSFQNKNNETSIGWLTTDGGVVDMAKANSQLPTDMLTFIDNHEIYFQIIKEQKLEQLPADYTLNEVRLLAPLPNPRSFRDYIGFEMHMLNILRVFVTGSHLMCNQLIQMPSPFTCTNSARRIRIQESLLK